MGDNGRYRPTRALATALDYDDIISHLLAFVKRFFTFFYQLANRPKREK
jgi:hypothetical protein